MRLRRLVFPNHRLSVEGLFPAPAFKAALLAVRPILAVFAAENAIVEPPAHPFAAAAQIHRLVGTRLLDQPFAAEVED